MKRRCSLNISLALMGALALTACAKEKRNVYKNKEDCLQDWGSEQSCEEVTDRNSSYGGHHYSSGYYYGPRYSGSGGAMHSSRSIAVARGGFGGFAGFHGGGS